MLKRDGNISICLYSTKPLYVIIAHPPFKLSTDNHSKIVCHQYFVRISLSAYNLAIPNVCDDRKSVSLGASGVGIASLLGLTYTTLINLLLRVPSYGLHVCPVFNFLFAAVLIYTT